jgi:hypothetical protein
MSVTITITDNHLDSAPRLDKVDCLCSFTYNESGDEIRKDPEPSCPYCDGVGFEVERVWPYEMNVANRNARTLFAALGLEAGEHLEGEISGAKMLKAVNAADHALMLRHETIEKVENGPTIIDSGISLEQAVRYTSALRGIAARAIMRGKSVCWK